MCHTVQRVLLHYRLKKKIVMDVWFEEFKKTYIVLYISLFVYLFLLFISGTEGN